MINEPNHAAAGFIALIVRDFRRRNWLRDHQGRDNASRQFAQIHLETGGSLFKQAASADIRSLYTSFGG